MNNDNSHLSEKVHISPYSHDVGSFSLSRPALTGLCREILNTGLPFRFAAPGPSMSPFIHDGDIITLAPYRADSCTVGDIVAFIQPGTERLVVHRVIGVSSNGCFIKGDNTNEEDGKIPHTTILGHAIRVERAFEDVRFGLGPERVIIALFSRWRLLPYFIRTAGYFCLLIRRLR